MLECQRPFDGIKKPADLKLLFAHWVSPRQASVHTAPGGHAAQIVLVGWRLYVPSPHCMHRSSAPGSTYSLSWQGRTVTDVCGGHKGTRMGQGQQLFLLLFWHMYVLAWYWPGTVAVLYLFTCFGIQMCMSSWFRNRHLWRWHENTGHENTKYPTLQISCQDLQQILILTPNIRLLLQFGSWRKECAIHPNQSTTVKVRLFSSQKSQNEVYLQNLQCKSAATHSAFSQNPY